MIKKTQGNSGNFSCYCLSEPCSYVIYIWLFVAIGTSSISHGTSKYFHFNTTEWFIPYRKSNGNRRISGWYFFLNYLLLFMFTKMRWLEILEVFIDPVTFISQIFIVAWITFIYVSILRNLDISENYTIHFARWWEKNLSKRSQT